MYLEPYKRIRSPFLFTNNSNVVESKRISRIILKERLRLLKASEKHFNGTTTPSRQMRQIAKVSDLQIFINLSPLPTRVAWDLI